MRDGDGFVAYYLLPAEDVVVAISMFSSEEEALASTDEAREFVAEYLAPMLPNPPLIVEGSIDLMYVALLDEMMIEDDMDDHSSEAEADDEMMTDDGNDIVVGLSVYDSEENALAANDIAATVVAEHMVEWIPEDVVQINSRLGVAGLAGLFDGSNLIDEMTTDDDMESESSE